MFITDQDRLAQMSLGGGRLEVEFRKWNHYEVKIFKDFIKERDRN